jgi:hypothetical protein
MADLYELGIMADDLASALGGVSEKELTKIYNALEEAFNAGKDGAELA